MIAEPLLAPVAKATESWPLLGVIEMIVGADGTARGVSVVVDENDPVPAALTVATRNVYRVPLTNPVTVTEVVVDTASLNVTQFAPPSLLNWMV